MPPDTEKPPSPPFATQGCVYKADRTLARRELEDRESGRVRQGGEDRKMGVGNEVRAGGKAKAEAGHS